MNGEILEKVRELASYILDPVEYRIFTILFDEGRLYGLTLFINKKHAEIQEELNFQKYDSTLLFQYIECTKLLSLIEDLIEEQRVDEGKQTEHIA